MNLVIIKYCLLIGAILATTAVVPGPLNPQNLFNDPTKENLTADSVYQLGSDLFYKEIDKPGNEYMKSGVEGYSHALVPTDEMEKNFSEQWGAGVAVFKSGYNGCTEAIFELAAVPEMNGAQEKAAVCTKIQTSRTNILQSLEYFAAAKGSATPGSSQGFTIGMAIPRIEQISNESEDAEIDCMQAVLADRNHDNEEFSRDFKSAYSHVREMQRIYPELMVVSDDFKMA